MKAAILATGTTIALISRTGSPLSNDEYNRYIKKAHMGPISPSEKWAVRKNAVKVSVNVQQRQGGNVCGTYG